MKHVLIVLLLATATAMATPTQAQVYKRASRQVTGTETKKVLTVEKTDFPLMQTTRGTLYVQAVSKAGKPYQVWVGSDTGDRFEGKKIYKMKSGSFCFYALTKRGYPRPVYLTRAK